MFNFSNDGATVEKAEQWGNGTLFQSLVLDHSEQLATTTEIPSFSDKSSSVPPSLILGFRSRDLAFLFVCDISFDAYASQPNKWCLSFRL